jgi:hypothetical protein
MPTMPSEALLTQFKEILTTAPDFACFHSTSEDHQQWLGQAHALLSRWNSFEAMSAKVAIDSLGYSQMREGSITKLFAVIYRAIAELELRQSDSSEAHFERISAGDYLRALSGVVDLAVESLLIVEPYLDEMSFDAFRLMLQRPIRLRFLVNEHSENLKQHLLTKTTSLGDANLFRPIEIRKNPLQHDRLVIIDQCQCWLLGQSILGAPTLKTSYLLPMSSDVAARKMTSYDKAWAISEAI